ncbi:hypothetical protein GGE65_006252 [Skermanella aerolata]|uniref:hypothetical protein n=1 Tax=Skermanella aerolata TaxID=393310 RepID=UPI003D1A3C3B
MAPFGATAKIWRHDAGMNATIDFPANTPLERKLLDLRDHAISRFKGPAQG